MSKAVTISLAMLANGMLLKPTASRPEPVDEPHGVSGCMALRQLIQIPVCIMVVAEVLVAAI